MTRILCLVFVLCSGVLSAQISGLDKDSPFKDRLFIGGGMDLAFNANYALIGASPSLGYMITKTTSAGVGITYQYYRDMIYEESTNIYGYRFFLMQRLFSQLFAYAEYENLSYEVNILVEDSPREWITGIYAGGGWFQPLSDRSGILALALYNFNYLEGNSANPSPWSFRMAITFNPF